MAPFNGAEVGGGRSAESAPAADQTPTTEAKDQFEQEGAVPVAEEEEETTPVPVPARPSQPYEHRGDPVKLKEVADIMTDLMTSNLSDLRVTRVAIELNGGHSLKISFGGSGKNRDERGRTLTLHTQDGTWEYSA